MTESKVLLGDMSAIREYGVDFLNDNYFWPVSESDFRNFSKFMYENYIEIIRNAEDDKLSDMAMVEWNFVNQLMRIFHYNYIKQYSIKNKLKLVVGEDSDYLINPEWDKIKTYYSNFEFPHNKKTRIIRRIIKNIVFNKNIPIFKFIHGFFKADAVSIGSNDRIKSIFLKEKKLFCDFRDWPDFFNSNIKSSVIVGQYNSLFLEKIINPFLRKMISHNSFFVKNMDFDKIKEVWSSRIFDAYSLYFNIRLYKTPSSLLVTEVSKPMHKLITVAYQSKGCKVYCFHHGNDFIATIKKRQNCSNILHCNNFVLPTDGIEKRYKEHISNIKCIKKKRTKFTSVNSREMYDLYLRNIGNVPKTAIDTVMIMGLPSNCNRSFGERGQFFYQQVDLVYRLILLLKSKNKKVLYKVHPERVNEIDGVFDTIVDEVVTDPFESVWGRSDLLIFTYTSTTTFGYALTTNLPIILLDTSSDLRDQDYMKLLDKRIERVHAKINYDTRITFNEDEFIKSLESQKIFSFECIDEIYKVA